MNPAAIDAGTAHGALARHLLVDGLHLVGVGVGVEPDVPAFGMKTQACGIAASRAPVYS